MFKIIAKKIDEGSGPQDGKALLRRRKLNAHLMDAVINGRENEALLLVSHGAALNAVGEIRAILEVAVTLENKPFVRLIVEAGADEDTIIANRNAGLMMAVSAGSTEMARFLVKELRADVNHVDDEGFTPLTAAVENRGAISFPSFVKAMVRCLVTELGANVRMEDGMGDTPLKLAADTIMRDLLTSLGAIQNEGSTLVSDFS